MVGRLTSEIRINVVKELASLAQEEYIHPIMGEKIAETLLAKLESDGYDDITDPHNLALRLKSELRQISNDKHWQFWTLPYVSGKRLPDIPVYVLTSETTFSGAEEFAYNLKHMGRATIVGETTGGGGHMVDLAVIQDNFQVLFPFAGAINPVTNSSWEAVGVIPHITVSQEDALKTAHLHALEKLIEACTKEIYHHSLVWDSEIVRSLYNLVIMDEATLSRYAGQYGIRTFGMEGGCLTYTSPQSSVWKLTPITKTRFRLNEDIKFEFILDSQGFGSAVVITYSDGRPEIQINKSI